MRARREIAKDLAERPLDQVRQRVGVTEWREHGFDAQEPDPAFTDIVLTGAQSAEDVRVHDDKVAHPARAGSAYFGETYAWIACPVGRTMRGDSCEMRGRSGASRACGGFDKS